VFAEKINSASVSISRFNTLFQTMQCQIL